jgi:hypothetical protein
LLPAPIKPIISTCAGRSTLKALILQGLDTSFF